MKVVINADFGGFGLSAKACEKLGARKGDYRYAAVEKRTDKKLVAVVEELGEEASGEYACLKVIEIPENVDWYIDEYDGWESIHEKHRVWK